MRLLLDTHVLIWSLTFPSRIPSVVQRLIADPDNEIFLSAASLFEIASKRAAGRRNRPDIPAEQILSLAKGAGFKLLSIDPGHAIAVETIAQFHGDPFDRLLLAQAQLEDMHLVTHDADIAAYDRRTILF